jgi:hypothetical protein
MKKMSQTEFFIAGFFSTLFDYAVDGPIELSSGESKRRIFSIYLERRNQFPNSLLSLKDLENHHHII